VFVGEPTYSERAELVVSQALKIKELEATVAA
jgi:hypothetical protein